jgi:hypothetical protein
MLVWLEWAHGLVDPVKEQVHRWLGLFAPGRAGRTMRLIQRIRARMRGQSAA